MEMLHNFPSMYIYCLNAMQCNRKHEKKHSPNSILCCFCCCWCCRCRVGYHHHCHAFIVVVVQRSRYYYFFPRIFFHCTYGAYGIHTTKGHFYLSYAFSEHRFPSIICLFCVFLLLFFRSLGKWKTALFMAVCNDDDLMMTNLVRSERRHE